MRWLRQIVYSFLLFLTLWLAGFAWFLSLVPFTPTKNDEPADAIVVLTGGGGRIEHGLTLFSKGMGKRIFITGTSPGVTVADLLEQMPAPLQKTFARLDRSRIVLGDEAENTIGNAEETARWLSKDDETIRLVTANYHMPRSLNEFRRALPKLRILPEPVLGSEFTLGEMLAHPAGRLILLSEYHKYVASEFRHLLLKLAPHPRTPEAG